MHSTIAQDLRRVAPSLSEHAFRAILAGSRVKRASNSRGTPAEMRDEFAALSNMYEELLEALAELEMTSKQAIDRELKIVGLGSLHEWRDALRRACGASVAVERGRAAEVVRHRSLSANTLLIRGLKEAIEAAGGQATAAPNGELVQAFSLAMRILGVSVADHKGTVRSALASIKGEASAP